jgi:hypothetical protein
LDSFCENRVFKMNIQFCCHLCCSSSVIFHKNPSQCMMLILPMLNALFLFTDAVLPWFMYADITLKTVTLSTPNNVAVYVTDAPAQSTPMICPLSKLDKSPIFWFFHMDWHSPQSLMRWHKHYRV